MQRFATRGVISVITLYRRVPRVRPPVCRFYPTCSQYAVTALETHGLLRGSALSLRRLGRCHPWGSMGWDPVPGTEEVVSRSAHAEGKAHLIDG